MHFKVFHSEMRGKIGYASLKPRYRLLTTAVEETAPALELATLYPSVGNWNRYSKNSRPIVAERRVLRSKTADLVRQEF